MKKGFSGGYHEKHNQEETGNRIDCYCSCGFGSSDKRGNFYGIYPMSELIGVSPWVYWGDVVPEYKDELVFSKEQLDITSREPSVKYRGTLCPGSAMARTFFHQGEAISSLQY
jgi:hypothetical protein